MPRVNFRPVLAVCIALAPGFAAGTATAAPASEAYGMPITLEQAKAFAATRPSGTMAIVDVYGEMVLAKRATNGRFEAFEQTIERAVSAINSGRGGRLNIDGAARAAGRRSDAVLLTSGGKVVGALAEAE